MMDAPATPPRGPLDDGPSPNGGESRAGDRDVLALARALVRTPSMNPALAADGTGEGDIAGLCAGWLASWGFETRRQEVAPGRFNVVGRLDASTRNHPEHPAPDADARAVAGPVLLLNGHLDTVGTDGMRGDPFEARVEDGRLHGRGAADMKGGVAALLSAARGVARGGGPASGRLLVALTVDEEHASIGMEAFASSLDEGVDAAIVCEPTELAVAPAHKGFLWLELLFRGVAAHGSRPRIGVDAVRHAARYLATLEPLHDELASGPSHDLLGHPSFHVGTIEGGSAPSVYPSRCRVVLERRTLPGESRADAIRPFAAALDRLSASEPDVDATLEAGLWRPGTEVATGHDLVRGLLDAVEAAGSEPRVDGMSAWVDAAWLNEAGIPAVCFGPGSIAQAHADAEWVEVDELRRCASVLERFAVTFFGGTVERPARVRSEESPR